MTRLKDVTITATNAKGHSPLSFVSKSYRAMDILLTEFDFTFEQAVEITRHLWPNVYEPFILSFAETLHEKGFNWLTNEYIDADEAEWIVNYLGLMSVG